MDYFNDNYNNDYDVEDYESYDDIEVKRWSFNRMKIYIIMGILIKVIPNFFSYLQPT